MKVGLLTQTSELSGVPLPFPKHYPTSVLLGYVEVVDCLSHQQLIEYKQRARDNTSNGSATELVLENLAVDEENDSEFVLVCTKPHRLVVPLAVSGQHKICTEP